MTKNKTKPRMQILFAAGICGGLLACGGSGLEGCYETTVDAALCDPASVTFSLDSTNVYYPLVVGNFSVLEGTEAGEIIRVERCVTNETQDIEVDGVTVTTRILQATEYINDEIYEVARNFYVEADNGTVCYFGEDVDFYENGQIANHNGTWRAGVKGAKPGVIMPATPAVGQAYFQEQAPDVAVDMGRVTEIGATKTIGGTEHQNVVTVRDINPMESCDEADEEPKFYVPNIGEAADTVKDLKSFATTCP